MTTMRFEETTTTSITCIPQRRRTLGYFLKTNQLELRVLERPTSLLHPERYTATFAKRIDPESDQGETLAEVYIEHPQTGGRIPLVGWGTSINEAVNALVSKANGNHLTYSDGERKQDIDPTTFWPVTACVLNTNGAWTIASEVHE